MKTNPTDKQAAFLAVLFSKEIKGDLRLAMDHAGYSSSSPTSIVTEPLSDEIFELTKKFIASSGTKAAYTMYEVIGGEAPLIGLKEKIAVSKDLLDRGGFAKTEKVEITSPNALFILPPKEKDEDEDSLDIT